MKIMHKKQLLTLCAAMLLMRSGMAQGQSAPKTLLFSGVTWEIRAAGKGGPGPNEWNPNNVWVDKAGMLHLKISCIAGKSAASGEQWQCAELTTRQRFGMGRYQFQVIGRIDRLDRNVVLGLFDYPTPDVGVDGTNEIDIEFARWGNPVGANGSYTIYPSAGKRAEEATHPFTFKLEGAEQDAYTTHRFDRASDKITLQSLYGHRDDDQNEFARWTFAPADKRALPQQPIPIHLNLWLFRGQPPVDNKEVEIILKAFTFTPAK